jgi:rSAM/selenodomain-associated transferase 2
VNISIIVPVLNEAGIIRGFLQHLRTTAPDAEIIVVDGGSNDATVELCRGLADHIIESARGRARQMNAGAEVSHGKILWFLHADSYIPASSLAAIEDALGDPQVAGGCFRLQIMPARWIYRVRDATGDVCVNLFRVALGDRGLFCRREHFFAISGYPDQPLLEDADFYCKLRVAGRVRQVPIRIQTSARRYEALGPTRTILFYLLIMTLYLARTKMSILEKMVRWFGSRKPRGTDILSVGQAGVTPALAGSWMRARGTDGTAMPQRAPDRVAATATGDICETISNLNP